MMTNRVKHERERGRHAAPAAKVALGGSNRRGHKISLLGGRLLINSPVALKPEERLLIEGAAEVPASHILSAALPRITAALSLALLRPEAQVTYYHHDLFYVRQAEMLASGHRLPNLECVCLPDLPCPEAAPELVLCEFRKDGEAGLTLELIRQGHERLARGGKLLAAINNPTDQWLRRQLERTFGNLSQVAKDKHGILYLVKRVDRPGEHEETPAATGERYFKKIEVAFNEETFTFETCYGTFSSDELDDGSRALLEMMTPPEPCEAILDLGGGWGGMGLLAAHKTGAKRLTMIDSNARAVDVARRNAARFEGVQTDVRLEADAESMQTANETGRYDLVVSNPPYGTEFRVTDLFIDVARRALKPGGTVWLVGKNNQHLVNKVEETFGNVEIHKRRGYQIVSATRREGR